MSANHSSKIKDAYKIIDKANKITIKLNKI